MHFLRLLLVVSSVLLSVSTRVQSRPLEDRNKDTSRRESSTAINATVLILGGGVAGVIAARTFYEQGIDFLIIEARGELGGRMMSHSFSGITVEAGANWVQGTQTGGGLANPIYELAKKHGLKTQSSDFTGSITTYDVEGQTDFINVVNDARDNYTVLTVTAGARVSPSLADITSRAGYSLNDAKPLDAHAKAAEYLHFDWEYGQTPEETSWIASSWANNFTFESEEGGFSEENLMSLDDRGFKYLIQSEAEEFVEPQQVIYNSVIKEIAHGESGVNVTLENGEFFAADYALCTFSLGVLQNDDVTFTPALPHYKQEAIQSMTMGTYTKIFLRFSRKFWFDTEMGLYADPERGRYPVWQSLDHPNFMPGSGIIFVTVTGDYSIRVESLPESQIKKEVIEVLQRMFPEEDIPEPVDFWFHRWHSDKLYRGSYSNWPANFLQPHHDNLRANVGRLYFAGEATSMKYFGFLHGAYFEGLHMAEEMAGCITDGRCLGLTHFEDVKNAVPYRV